MKKALLAIALLFTFGMSMNAQNALGLRCGWGGTELSYQMGMGGNRLELDLGWWGDDNWSYLNLTGIYQWTGTISGDFGWFAGLGANLGLFSGDAVTSGNLGLALGGQAGLEYNFSFPLQVTLDVRPMWNFIGHNAGFGWGAALGLRYRF